MADLDIPGLGRARMALTELSQKPNTKGGASGVKQAIIKELYTEIRAARIAGYSWKKITERINQNVQISVTPSVVRTVFCSLDKKLEVETGVKALPERKPKGKKN